jgi:Protein of unknwon function (DUF3310)
MDKPVDNVNHPPHYLARKIFCSCENENSKPIECIDVSSTFNFNLGNAIKYIWRCDFKGNKKEDLEKAIWYIQNEISNL